MSDLPSNPFLDDLLIEEESRSFNEQDAELDLKVSSAANPITKGQSRKQIQAIFSGHEGLAENSERSEATALNSDFPSNPSVSPRASVPLHGQNNANTGIIHEKPIHRAMAYMVAQGKSQREIAELTGYSEGQLSQICRQQWFREMVTNEVDAAGRDEVKTLFAGAVVDTIHVLIELRDKAKTESVRLNSAKEILDRAMGKAPQHIVQEINTSSSDPLKELQELQAELDVLTPRTGKN